MKRKALEERIRQLELEISVLKDQMLTLALRQGPQPTTIFIPAPQPTYIPYPQPIFQQPYVPPFQPTIICGPIDTFH